MNEKWTRRLLEWMPKRPISRCMHRASDLQPPGALLRPMLRIFAGKYGIDLDEAEFDLEQYPSFDAFFTRRLKPGARTVDPDPGVVVSPADGQWARSGRIEDLHLEQIKGKRYSADELLRSVEKAKTFRNGSYATIYLSPKNYHRVHFPCSGNVTAFHYIPGEVFPVNPPSVQSIDHLFTRNERLVTYLESEHGKAAIVLVAATCVSRITQSYDPERGRFVAGKESKKTYFEPIAVEKGRELGVFHLGSTVVMLLEENRVLWDGRPFADELRFGESIGTWINES